MTRRNAKQPARTVDDIKTLAEAKRIIQGIQNRYDAAGTGRRMRGWNPPNSGPNLAIKGVEKLRDRSRDSVRNDWSGESGIQHWVTNLIGVGIVPRLKRVKSKTRKEALIKLWDAWCKTADADGVLDFYGLQTLATRAWLESGEVFVRMRPRRFDSELDVPFQVQLIEADFVPMLDADYYQGLPQGNRIRSGIELNRIGQRVAYWVYKEHPGEGVSVTTLDPSRLVRVAASQMLHVFEPKRPGQLRGVPNHAAVLARLRNVLDFDDAVLERQKLANLFAMFIKKPALTAMDDGIDPMTGLPVENDLQGPIAALEPGLVQELGPGEEVQFANPPEPGTTYGDYMRSQNLGTAAGQGLPYEIMSGDIKEVSDRTLRVVMNEFRRYAEQRQWQIIIPKMCQPIRAYWANQAALAGQIELSEVEDAMDVQWAPQGWAYIHPVQDVQAKQTEVEAGFRSRSSVIAEKGDDPEAVDEERAADQKREKDLDIQPAVPQPGQPAQGGKKEDGDGIAPGEYPRNAALDNLMASVGRLETLVATVQAHASAQQPAPPNITVNNHMPAVAVTNQVEPTPLVVNNEVNPTPVTIENNVAAPNVEVTNEVQPAEVTVNLPARQTDSIIGRDRDGNITKVTQVEKTIQ